MGPIAFALKVIDDVTEVGSLRDTFAAYRPATVLLGCLKVSALALPTVAMLSIGMYLLWKLRRDSFLIAFGVGMILVSVSIGLTIHVMVGPSPQIYFDEPYVLLGIAIVVLVFSALLSALYWLLAVRRDRRRRLLAESDAQAIRAME
ncbi:MAG: hypothetical protein HC861_10745 [Rhodospirillaceae bacterium]|nr:hypothetical protein [Rhodospirillaceae bacterium]